MKYWPNKLNLFENDGQYSRAELRPRVIKIFYRLRYCRCCCPPASCIYIYTESCAERKTSRVASYYTVYSIHIERERGRDQSLSYITPRSKSRSDKRYSYKAFRGLWYLRAIGQYAARPSESCICKSILAREWSQSISTGCCCYCCAQYRLDRALATVYLRVLVLMSLCYRYYYCCYCWSARI